MKKRKTAGGSGFAAKNILLMVYLLVFLLILLGFSYLEYRASQTTYIDVSQEEILAEDCGENLYVTMPHSKDWREPAGRHGVQYDVTIFNSMDYELTDWVVKIKLPDGVQVTDSWNIEYTLDEANDILTARSVDYNALIEAQSVCTFGFILNCKTIEDLAQVELRVAPILHIYDFSLFWVLVFVSCVLFILVLITVVVEIKLSPLRNQRIEDRNIIEQSMKTFSNFIDAKDPYTKGHSIRVAYYTRELAILLGLSQKEVEKLYYIALLHDVGKLSIPDAILNKPGKLTPEERHIMEAHTTHGARMLEDFTAISGIAEGALYHHEHYDGKGYPKGLVGEDIPFYARIICVADSYDAMSSDRCYRPKLARDVIINELDKNAGKQFDPEVVACMLELMQSEQFNANVPV